MNGFRDIEQLSAYLDGQLSPSDSARLESRLKSDPEFASAYDDLRSARGILRKLPSRKAPRNFTLTRKMVGLKPPLPRSYFTFRFATAFATFLFAITIAVNSLAPRLNFAGPIPGYGMGGGGGGGCTGGCGGGPGTVYQLPPVSAAATEAPAAAAEMAPAPTNDMTFSADATNAERIAETPVAKEPTVESQQQPPVQKEAARIPIAWQTGLLIVSLLGAVMLFLMNQSAKRKWQ
jgi:hypothetical protein